MIWLQVMVTAATLIAISAGFPQLLKLIRLKSSAEFNLGTWVMWALTQVILVSYAASIYDKLLIAVNGCWLIFYGVMVVLIIRYRPKHQPALVEPLPMVNQPQNQHYE